jgi:hypothetical protein
VVRDTTSALKQLKDEKASVSEAEQKGVSDSIEKAQHDLDQEEERIKLNMKHGGYWYFLLKAFLLF